MAEQLPLVYTSAPDYGAFTLKTPMKIIASAPRDVAHSKAEEIDLSRVKIYEGGYDTRSLYHPTTQIIPLLSDGRILLTDKYERTRLKHELRGQPYAGPPHIYDFASGGHITMSDLPATELESREISDETALECALRELNEELHARDGRPFTRGDLEYLRLYKYADDYNRELTYTYLCRLRGNADNYYVLDDYVGADSLKHDIELPVFALTAGELSALSMGEGAGVEYKLQIGLECVLKSGLGDIIMSE